MRSLQLRLCAALLFACSAEKDTESVALQMAAPDTPETPAGQIVDVGTLGLRLSTATGEAIPIASDGSFTLPAGTTPADVVITVPDSDPKLTCSLDASGTPWKVVCQVARTTVAGNVTGVPSGTMVTVTVTAGGKQQTTTTQGAYSLQVEAYANITVSVSAAAPLVCTMTDARNATCELPMCMGDCTGKSCGDNGCGGSCGDCPGSTCGGDGQCVPVSCGSIDNDTAAALDYTLIQPWQTFTLAADGKIAALQAQPNTYDDMDANGDNLQDYRVRIYAGEGTAGTVLLEQQFNGQADLGGWQWVRFAFDTPLAVTASTVYTWEIYRTDGEQRGMMYTQNDSYAGGHASPAAASWDFLFKLELGCP